MLKFTMEKRGTRERTYLLSWEWTSDGNYRRDKDRMGDYSRGDRVLLTQSKIRIDTNVSGRTTEEHHERDLHYRYLHLLSIYTYYRIRTTYDRDNLVYVS